MKRYAIYPKRVTLIDGVTVTPDAAMGYVETDLPARDMLAMLGFGTASIIECPSLETVESEQVDAPKPEVKPPEVKPQKKKPS
jgi:hypothetical protein